MKSCSCEGIAQGAIQAVILDYGEVLSLGPRATQVACLAGAFGLDAERFLPHYFAERNPLDRGDVSAEAYWANLATRMGVPMPNTAIDTLRRWDVEMWTDLNPVMLDWLKKLRAAGLATGLLSNMPADMAEYVRRQFDWLSEFNHLTISHEVRRIKPEPEIFLHCLNGLGTRPEQALFIDDREVNVAAACKLGIQGIRFESPAQLSAELARLGFPVLPSATIPPPVQFGAEYRGAP